MTAKEFENLDDNDKKVALFEANKIAEKLEGSQKTEVFKIDNFYIESKTSMIFKTKRVLTIVTSDRMNDLQNTSS